MNSSPQESHKNLATSLLEQGFPELSHDEEQIIAASLVGELDAEAKEAQAAILSGLPALAGQMESLRSAAAGWNNDSTMQKLRERALGGASQEKRRAVLADVWDSLRSLARLVGEECAALMGDFVPTDFELAGALLGGPGENEGLLPKQVVQPWLGESFQRAAFSITAPDGVACVELDVSGPSGSIYRKEMPVTPGASVEVPFQEAGMKEGSTYKWCLACENANDPDGERTYTRGVINVTPSDKKGAVQSLASRAAQTGSTLVERSLMESAVLCEQQCFDAFLSKMQEISGQHRAVKDQQSALLLSHWAFRRMRNQFLAAGLSGEGDRIYGLLFGVEKELERIS